MLAIWFHDAIYDSPIDYNEERSAVMVELILQGCGVAHDIVMRVALMIRATKDHGVDNDDYGTQVLLDIDMSILNADPTVFAAYEQVIRRESLRRRSRTWHRLSLIPTRRSCTRRYARRTRDCGVEGGSYPYGRCTAVISRSNSACCTCE